MSTVPGPVVVLTSENFTLTIDPDSTAVAAQFAANAQASANASAASAATSTSEAATATVEAAAALGSQNAAAASAAAALASQNAAAASQTASATSAATLTSAIASLNAVWLGPLAADPSTNPLTGGALVIGAAYENTTTNKVRVYTSTGWQDQDETAESASASASLAASQAAASAGAAAASSSAAAASAAAAGSSATSASGYAVSALASATSAAANLAAAVGELPLNLAGQSGVVALTAAQAINAIWQLTGALAGNVTLQVPNSGVLPHNFVVNNGTSGLYSVTVTVQGQTPSAAVVQGTSPVLFSDATGVYATSSVTGVQFATPTLLPNNPTLSLTSLGKILYVTAAAQTVQFPLAASYPAGGGFALKNVSGGTAAYTLSGGDTSDLPFPFTAQNQDSIYFSSDGVSVWHAAWVSNKFAPTFITSVASPLALFGAGAASNGTDVIVAQGSIGATGTGGVLRMLGAATGGIASLLSTALGLALQAAGSNPITFSTNGAERGRFSPAGNLLVGTVTDNGTDMVQVTGSVNAETSLKTPLALINGASTNATDVVVASGSIGATGTGGVLRIIGAATAGIAQLVSTALGLQITATGVNPIEFFTNALERMRLTGAGNLLIGTTTDDGTHLLQVNGGIRSETGGFTFPDGTTQTTANGVTAPTSTVYTAGSGFAVGATSITTSGYTAPFVVPYRNSGKMVLGVHYTLPGDSLTINFTEPLGQQDMVEVLTGVIYSPSTVYTPADQAFTPLAGATGLTYAHTVGFCLLFNNGDKLVPGVDYTETSAGFTFVGFTADGLETYEVWNLTPITIANTLPLSGGTLTGLVTASAAGIAFSDGSVQGIAIGRNRLINGGFGIDQRNSGASQTITAAAALAYTVDRFYAYCTGANVTGQRVAGSGSAQYGYQFTGAASVTGIGFGQRIETANSYDLNGQTATFSVELANSLLTTVTWTAYYANTADTFGTLASPTRTQIATGTFTVSATRARYAVQIAIPTAATTGVEVVLSVGAQTSGTWSIWNAQFERGPVATPFERRPGSEVLAACQRYYEIGNFYLAGYSTTSVGLSGPVSYKVSKRVVPTLTTNVTTTTNISSAPIGLNAVDQWSWLLQTTASAGYAYYGTYTSAAEL